jgi:TolA-binding protein
VRLADQLRLAGEDEMSFEFYWEAAQRAPERFVDPQTSLPLDKEDCINGEPVVNNQAWVVFWNALAVDPDESRKTESMMEEFVTTYPDSRAAGLAHVFLAQSYETNNRRPEAIEQLKAIPDDLAGTRGVLSLYDKLATAVPPAIKKKYDESEAGEKDRISTLRTAIGNDPNAPNTDARIMELAYLLTKQGEYAQAAVNYELLAVRYPDSPYCPRAIYTAQIIYRTKLNDEGHAARLVELLRTKYPDSRYASVLRG